MTLTPQLCAELIRQRLGIADGSKDARVIGMIPQALKAFGRKVAADPNLRHLLVTDKDTVTAAVNSGTVDLTTLYTTYRLLLEYLDRGVMYRTAGAIAEALIDPVATEIWVENAGDSNLDGIYTLRGTHTGLPYYNLTGQPNSTANYAIVGQWTISDAVGVVTYQSNDLQPTDYPFLSFWESVNPADDPAPTVKTPLVITITSDLTKFADDTPVRLAATTSLPAGLSASTTYYIFDYTLAQDGLSATFKLATAVGSTTPLLISDFGSGTITVRKWGLTDEQPLQPLRSPQQLQLTRQFDGILDNYVVQGDKLMLAPAADAGFVHFAVPYYPATLALLPESEEVERLFLDKLYELAAGGPNDAAQDGPK